MPQVANVALELSLTHAFSYLIPDHLTQEIHVGSLVEVPLKTSFKKGIVLAISNQRPPYPLKPIHQVLKNDPLIPPDLLKLADWIASHYCTPLPLVLPSILPSRVRKDHKQKEQYVIKRAKTREEIIALLAHMRKKSPSQSEVLDHMLKQEGGQLLTEVLEITKASRTSIDALVKQGVLHKEKVRQDRSPLTGETYFRSKPKVLSREQQEALDKISSSLNTKEYATHLLFGVTGSGKTEIYLQAISKALSYGAGSIMLVPEIALTTQTIEHFQSRFEGKIAILHSALSPGEKHDEWEKIKRGDAQIVIGARSAIFSPVKNLGLIIVDEEHESSYKQSDSMPSYHARDVAVMRGFFANATVVLGSATPSLESFHNAKIGKYTLSCLKARPKLAEMPTVTIIDMKKEYDKKKGVTIFSEKLLSEIEKRKKAAEQTILFLNRRGFHTMMLCTACGNSIKCTQCDLALTFHKSINTLSCHLCAENLSPPPRICPHCNKEHLLKFKGIGTQQVESALYAIFPDIRIMRLDADTTKHKGSHQKIYKAFRTGKADILIGTQMLAKGLHFPEVTLVGVLNSDISLNIPDFRSGETTFQLLTQVAGRAGRGVSKGEVLIQTCIPENSIIQHAAKQDFENFFQEEYSIRKQLNYPPFAQLAKIRFTGKDLDKTKEAAASFRLKLTKELPSEYEISPVDTAGHAKIKEMHRLQFLIKGPKMSQIQAAIKKIGPEKSSIRCFIDINPTSTFF